MLAPVTKTEGNTPIREIPMLINRLIGMAIELLFLKISNTSFAFNIGFLGNFPQGSVPQILYQYH